MSLLDNAGNMQMLMGGLGLLTSKYKDDSDKYLNLANQGLLNRGKINRQTAMDKRQSEQDIRANSFQDMQMKNYQSQIEARGNPQTNSKYANTPFYAQDSEGNTFAYQLNNQGQPRQIQLPNGQSPAVPHTALDTGGGFQMMNRFGVMPPTQSNSQSPLPIPKVIPKTLAPAQQPQHLAEVVTAKAEANNRAESQDQLATNLAAGQRGVDLIDSIINHPGRELATGTSSPIGSLMSIVPGTDAGDFQAKKKQLLGTMFMQAREGLKGTGTITDFESNEAKAAVANVENSQSEEQFLESLNNLRLILTKEMDIQKSKSGTTQNRVFDPTTGGFK